MSVNTPINYAATAYRPDSIPVQPTPSSRPKSTGALDHNLSVRLPWGYTEDVIPNSLLSETNPANLNRIEKLVAKQNSLRGEFDEEFDHICIRPASLSGSPRFWNIVYQFGRSTLPLFIGILIFIFLIDYFSPNGRVGFKDFFISYIPFIVVFMSIPIIPWLLSSLYFRLFPVKAGKGSAWEINRQTGLITVYQEEQGERIAHSNPFYEFDAYLVNIASHQGIMRYQFALRHRYEALAINNLFPSGAFDRQEEGWAMWYFIQNYMDVSRPLPELGSLERWRQLDPATRADDLKTGRSPRYWRDMSYKQWKQACYQMGAKIANLQLGGKPDLMAKYVDYRHAHSFATRE